MEFIQAKSLLHKPKHADQWFGIDYNMNIYRGCSHGCIYCDSRSSCYGVDNFDRVRAKANSGALLEKELRSKRQKGVVGIGAMSDSYTPYERKYGLTREALELIERYNFGVCLATKSNLVTRDIDVLERINAKQNVLIQFSITTTDDALCKKIERHVAPSSARFDAMRKISEAGIFTGVLLMPVLPFITDNDVNIVKLVRASAANGARFIYPGMGMTLRDNQRDHFYEKLADFRPELISKYQQTYGDKYNCTSTKAKRIFYQFQDECVKHGILYKMPDIIKAYKQPILPPNDQLTLF